MLKRNSRITAYSAEDFVFKIFAKTRPQDLKVSASFNLSLPPSQHSCSLRQKILKQQETEIHQHLAPKRLRLNGWVVFFCLPFLTNTSRVEILSFLVQNATFNSKVNTRQCMDNVCR